jgi:hypothetical protein
VVDEGRKVEEGTDLMTGKEVADDKVVAVGDFSIGRRRGRG